MMMLIITGTTQEAEKEEDGLEPACQETWSKVKRTTRCNEDGGDEETSCTSGASSQAAGQSF